MNSLYDEKRAISCTYGSEEKHSRCVLRGQLYLIVCFTQFTLLIFLIRLASIADLLVCVISGTHVTRINARS